MEPPTLLPKISRAINTRVPAKKVSTISIMDRAAAALGISTKTALLKKQHKTTISIFLIFMGFQKSSIAFWKKLTKKNALYF